ncbi:MAG TPA: hypothetical protein VF143_08250 [Candidatus Nanopelagicales bacterium]
MSKKSLACVATPASTGSQPKRRLHPRAGATVLAAAFLACGLASAPAASAAPAAGSPAKTCDYLASITDETDPLFGLYDFIATQPGGCESTIASVGIAALSEGAFPSQAAAVGNCKAIEDEVGGYPYQFYGGFLDNVEAVTAALIEDGVPPDVAAAMAPIIVDNYLANVDLFTAENRPGCVRVLQGLHSGELFGLIFPALPTAS